MTLRVAACVCVSAEQEVGGKDEDEGTLKIQRRSCTDLHLRHLISKLAAPSETCSSSKRIFSASGA